MERYNLRRKRVNTALVEGGLKRHKSDDFIVEDEDYLSDQDYTYNDTSSYFDLDSSLIQKDVVNRLHHKTNIKKSLLKRVVKESFGETAVLAIQDYVGAKPADKRWKLGLSVRQIEKLEPILQDIRHELNQEIPSIKKILEANITKNDKKLCLRYFDRWNNVEPYTAEYYSIMDAINIILAKESTYNIDLRALENLEKQLQPTQDNLKVRILSSDMPDKMKNAVYQQYLNMEKQEPGSQTWVSLKESIDWSLRIPVTDHQIRHVNLTKFYRQAIQNMNQELYGMQDVKSELLHIYHDRLTSHNKCGRNIAFKGPPGVGKTQIGKTFAKVMGLPFRKISLAGVKDSSILRGSNKVWQDSGPSLIIQEMIKAGSPSCVIMLDEVDKLSREVQFALLDVLDYSNNHEFRDSYLSDYTHDFSKIFFICCMNDEETVAAFADRLDIIQISDYSVEDKRIILKDYIFPRALRAVGLSENSVSLNKEAVNYLIDTACPNGSTGLRTVEKIAKSIVGKINMYNSMQGSLDLGYTIPGFNIPLVVTRETLTSLNF